MRGAISVSAQLHDNEFVTGEDNLTLYQFNIRTAKYFFYKTCGIHKHHRRRSNPNQLGINVGCVEGVRPFGFPEILMMDGFSTRQLSAPDRVSPESFDSSQRSSDHISIVADIGRGCSLRHQRVAASV